MSFTNLTGSFWSISNNIFKVGLHKEDGRLLFAGKSEIIRGINTAQDLKAQGYVPSNEAEYNAQFDDEEPAPVNTTPKAAVASAPTPVATTAVVPPVATVTGDVPEATNALEHRVLAMLEATKGSPVHYCFTQKWSEKELIGDILAKHGYRYEYQAIDTNASDAAALSQVAKVSAGKLHVFFVMTEEEAKAKRKEAWAQLYNEAKTYVQTCLDHTKNNPAYKGKSVVVLDLATQGQLKNPVEQVLRDMPEYGDFDVQDIPGTQAKIYIPKKKVFMPSISVKGEEGQALWDSFDPANNYHPVYGVLNAAGYFACRGKYLSGSVTVEELMAALWFLEESEMPIEGFWEEMPAGDFYEDTTEGKKAIYESVKFEPVDPAKPELGGQWAFKLKGKLGGEPIQKTAKPLTGDDKVSMTAFFDGTIQTQALIVSSGFFAGSTAVVQLNIKLCDAARAINKSGYGKKVKPEFNSVMKALRAIHELGGVDGLSDKKAKRLSRTCYFQGLAVQYAYRLWYEGYGLGSFQPATWHLFGRLFGTPCPTHHDKANGGKVVDGVWQPYCSPDQAAEAYEVFDGDDENKKRNLFRTLWCDLIPEHAKLPDVVDLVWDAYLLRKEYQKWENGNLRWLMDEKLMGGNTGDKACSQPEKDRIMIAVVCGGVRLMSNGLYASVRYDYGQASCFADVINKANYINNEWLTKFDEYAKANGMRPQDLAVDTVLNRISYLLSYDTSVDGKTIVLSDTAKQVLRAAKFNSMRNDLIHAEQSNRDDEESQEETLTRKTL